MFNYVIDETIAFRQSSMKSTFTVAIMASPISNFMKFLSNMSEKNR